MFASVIIVVPVVHYRGGAWTRPDRQGGLVPRPIVVPLVAAHVFPHPLLPPVVVDNRGSARSSRPAACGAFSPEAARKLVGAAAGARWCRQGRGAAERSDLDQLRSQFG